MYNGKIVLKEGRLQIADLLAPLDVTIVQPGNMTKRTELKINTGKDAEVLFDIDLRITVESQSFNRMMLFQIRKGILIAIDRKEDDPVTSRPKVENGIFLSFNPGLTAEVAIEIDPYFTDEELAEGETARGPMIPDGFPAASVDDDIDNP